ncbi:hypothetical protein BN1708_020585, partial [Verticillium longisporum]
DAFHRQRHHDPRPLKPGV